MKECFSCKRCFGDHNEFCDIDSNPLKSTLAGLPIIADRYRLDERIAAGALGTTYLGFDIETRQSIVVKVVLSEYVQADPDCVKVFLKEADATSAIEHPNVVKIYDFGVTQSNYLYVVMERLEGPSLKSVLSKQGAMDPARAVNITCALCEGVNAAHKQGQLHRDLKPSNAVLTRNEHGEERVKLLDFGLSRIKSPEMLNVLPPNKTQPSILGTPYYISPEQCESEEYDERSEVYSIGIILYHMLTGDVPFKGYSFPNVLEKHIKQPPKPPRSIKPDIPENVEEAALRAIEKDPDRRFQSVLAFSNILRQGLKQPARRRPTMSGNRPIDLTSDSGRLLKRPSSDKLVSSGGLYGSGKSDSGKVGIGKSDSGKVDSSKDERKGEIIKSVVSDISSSIEQPPTKPTAAHAIGRTTQPNRVISSEPAASAGAPTPPKPVLPKQPPAPAVEPVPSESSKKPVQQVSQAAPPPAAEKTPPPGSHKTPPPPEEKAPPARQSQASAKPSTDPALSQSGSTRRKLPPPPPHEDRPEHYQKRQSGGSRPLPPSSTGSMPARPSASLDSKPGGAETPKLEAGQVCLVEPPSRAAASKAEVRPAAISPAAVVYLFPDQFLQPKKLRQFKREMHNFFVVERESLAALMLVQAILSLRRRNSLKLSAIGSISPLLARKLDLSEEDKLALQLVNGSVKPLDALEKLVIASLGKWNAASLKAVYLGFAETAAKSGRSVAPAEAVNDTVAEELADFRLVERARKTDKFPLDPGESENSYKLKDEEAVRYFSQLDDVKQLVASVKEEPPIVFSDKRVPLFDYLFDYYRELFCASSAELAASLKT